MILLIDNYDSFVFNLARHFQRLGQETRVVRNTAVDADAVCRMRPDAVVISPGPCTPRQAGCSLAIVRALHRELPILGVCLGHQALAEALGGTIVRAPEPMHGRTSKIFHDNRGLFEHVRSPFVACRYHSLVVDRASLPESLEVSAWTDDGIVMGLQHRELPLAGVQFHPESILTEAGYPILAAFLKQAGLKPPEPLPTAAGERSDDVATH